MQCICADGEFVRCELQYDYGLRQMRHRKLEDRPTSFISALGKEITVSSAGKVMAASNEGVLERGKVRSFGPIKHIKPHFPF